MSGIDDLRWGLCTDPECRTCVSRRWAADRIDTLEAALTETIATLGHIADDGNACQPADCEATALHAIDRLKALVAAS